MRILILCLLTISFISCNKRIVSGNESSDKLIDTVYIEVPMLNEERIKELEADVEFYKSKLDSVDGSIPLEVYMNARKIEKVKYYISICEKKTSNKKYFFGWIKRTMSDQ